MSLMNRINPVEVRAAAKVFVDQKSDEFALDQNNRLGRQGAQSIGKVLSDSSVKNSQINGVLNIANSTESIADIVDTLKIRIGRDNGKGWKKENVGQNIMEILVGLRSDCEQFTRDHKVDGAVRSQINRVLHLILCRKYLQHIAAHFEYMKSLTEEKGM